MIDMSEFRVVETVYESDQTIVQRAVNIHNQMPVVLKCAKHIYNWTRRIYFFHEYHTAASLQLDCVHQPLALINTSENLAVVYKDTRSISLNKAVSGRLFQTDEIIRLFHQSAEALHLIHSKGWIHMDLSLDHILLNTDTGQIYIIDWQSAVKINEKSVLYSPYPRGNFETMSPERTGFTNFSVDKRSDLYSLGCIFYELFTNSPPFRENNAFRLIQAQVNSQPVPPHEGYDPYIPITQHVPETISNILMKLLSKNPSKRYDSALSLKKDILSCMKDHSFLNSLSTKTESIDLKSSKSKTNEQNELSKAIENIYLIFNSFCSQQDNQTNENSHDSISQRSNFLLISGDQATDKTAICKSLIPYVWKQNGFWIQETFSCSPDQPLAVLGRILSTFLFHFRQHFLQDLENHLKRLVSQGLTCPLYLHEIIPEILSLEGILVSKNRFSKMNIVSVVPFFLSLFQLISKKFQPVVICLQQLQRADQESLLLLETLICHSSVSLFVVGTCSQHIPQKIQNLLNNCKEQQVKVHQIQLNSRSNGHTEFRFSDYIQPNEFSKTDLQFYQKASCLGNNWNINILRQLTEDERPDIEHILQKALQCGIIVPAVWPKGNDYWYQDEHSWMFSDEIIQQFFYQSMSSEEKQKCHSIIYEKLSSKEFIQFSDKSVYTTARHSQYAKENNFSKEKICQLARICMAAGERSLMAGVPLSAYEFFSYGLSIFETNDWNDHHLQFDLQLNALKAANFISNDLIVKDAETSLLMHAQTDQEKIKAYECLARMYYRRGDHENVLNMVKKGLANTGIHMDRIPEIMYSLYTLKTAFKHRQFNINTIDGLISNKNIKLVCAIRLITFLILSGKQNDIKKISGVVALGIHRMSKVHLTTDTAFLWIMFACYLSDRKGLKSISEKWAQMGHALINRLTDFRLQSETRLTFFWCISHRKKAVSLHLEYLKTEINRCFHQGNKDLAIRASAYYLLLSINCGIKLKTLLSDLHDIQKRLGCHIDKIDMISMCRQTLLNLLSGITPPHILSGQAFDEQKAIQVMENHSDISNLFLVYSIKLMLSVLFKKYDKAVILAEKISDDALMKGTPLVSMNYCYASLAYLGAYHSASSDEQKKWKKIIQRYIQSLKQLADQCPENAIHRYYLVLAEYSNQLDLKADIADYYDQAISNARSNHYYQDLALANELAGEFYSNRNKDKLAKPYIEDAYQAYINWGADRKASEYIKQEKMLQQQTHSNNFIWPASVKKNASKTASPQQSSTVSRLDHDDIWILTQSFCTELNLNKLLEKIIQTVLQHSGAHKGCVILKKNNVFFVEAHLNIETQEKYLMIKEPLETTTILCVPIAQQVIQTYTPVCLWDAGKQGEFQYDNYVRENSPRSLLCIPLLYADQISGLLYLENKRITNLFSTERVKRMQIIASQATIAIKNAQFFHSQETIMQNRSTDLNLTVHQLSTAIQDLEARSREMFLLNQLSDALHGCPTEKASYEVLKSYFIKLFPGDQGILWLKKNDVLFVAVAWGDIKPGIAKQDLFSCKCFKSKTMFFIEDVASTPRCPSCGDETDQIYLCIPLKDQTGNIGVLHFQFGISRPLVFDDTFTRLLESRRLLVCRMIEHYALSLANLRLREALKYESMHDPLTGLFNRRHMQKMLNSEYDKAVQNHQYLGVIMVDIDHFKSFNDTYGHDIGDLVLIHLGKYLQKNASDRLIPCRYGGEEFLVMSSQCTVEDLYKTAESIRQGIMNDIKVPYKDHYLDVTASLGGAVFPEHGQSMTDVLKAADDALYKAKENGRNQVALAGSESL